jgi:hypothetical protein
MRPSEAFYYKQHDDNCEWMEFDKEELAIAFNALHERLEMIEELLTDAQVLKTNETVQLVRSKCEHDAKTHWKASNGNLVPKAKNDECIFCEPKQDSTHEETSGMLGKPKQEPKCEHDMGYYWWFSPNPEDGSIKQSLDEKCPVCKPTASGKGKRKDDL